MSVDYYKTLIKDIIENNDKEEAIKIIANKLNKKQMSNEKEILANIEKAIEIERLKIIEEKYKDSQLYIKDFKEEIERLNNIIKELREYIEEMQIWLVDFEEFGITTKGLLEILDKGE